MQHPRQLGHADDLGSQPDVDLDRLRGAVAEQAARVTPGIADIATYCEQQNLDEAHRAVLGPQLPGGGASGLIAASGWVLAEWGDPGRVEMTFSVTKSVVSLVAGLAYDDGLLVLDEPVCERVELPEFAAAPSNRITWRHLLDQTSGWQGQLWGKPASVDAQSGLWPGSAPDAVEPGRGWAYNDVRVNLCCLALTALLRRPLPEVLHERIMAPLGASDSWVWHGYRNSTLRLDGSGGGDLPVVSGGGHWGGGLWISAGDLALLGELCLRGGMCGDRRLISREWLDLSWTPCAAKPDYGLLWWLNDERTVFPEAPASGRVARGNQRRHLLWIDPDRAVVVAAHWSEDIGVLLRQVSELIPAT